MLAAGKQNKAIAEQLGYSLHTIEVYVSQRKAEVHAADRVDLVLRARAWVAGLPAG